MDKFKASNFFDLNSFDFGEIFSGTNFAWEAIPKIEGFIKSVFEKSDVKPEREDNVFIDPEAFVDPSAKIIGPAIILKGAKIRFNAYIRENVIVGKNSIVGFGVEVKNSIIMDNSSISHFNHVADSILGNNVNLAAGVQIANLRFDKQNVTVKSGNEKIDTELEKFGAIIGDNCQIGANAVLNPGTVLGKNCVVYPLATANGTYPENSILK